MCPFSMGFFVVEIRGLRLTETQRYASFEHRSESETLNIPLFNTRVDPRYLYKGNVYVSRTALSRRG